jgi:PAS domain S-box-containing protein
VSNEDWRPGQRGDAPDQDNDWHRKLLDGSLQGILVIDRDDHVVYVNQAICNILGYDNADDMLVLAKSSILIAAEDRTRLGRYRDDRLAGRTAPNTYRYRGRRRDGELVWLTNLCRSITLHGQEVVQNSITDISKQVKAEDDLRRSEQRYRDLFESTILGILIFDGQGRPLLVNQATATLFGYYKPEQIVELASIAPLSADPDPKQRLDY